MNEGLKQYLKDAGYNGSPDLSGLIEACGSGFRVLYQLNSVDMKKFYVANFSDGTLSPSDFEKNLSKTPEEALVKLWIALNKKKQ